MKIANRSKQIVSSLTRALFNETKKYNGVIDLTLGDPDFDTPKNIKEAGVKAILNNKTHYSENAGLIEARKAVCEHIKEIWDIDASTENVAITVGGMEALYLALLSIVDPGDEVIIFAPYYVNYFQMIAMCGGTPVIVDGYDSKKGISIEKELLEDKITEKTVAIIINSPNNPTGGVIPKESLRAIAELSQKYDIAVISDEVYRVLTYDGNKHESILQFDEAKKRTILIDSLSKEFCMTGWRIGYAYGPSDIIASMVKLQENVAACASVPAQYALISAYRSNISNKAIVDEFCKRRDQLCESLSRFKGIKYQKPQGTFYLFVDISDLNMSGEEFAYRLLREKHVAVVPGKAYGDSYDKYIRIAFTKDIKVLEEAAERIGEFIIEHFK